MKKKTTKKKTPENPQLNRVVLVRNRSAGVHCGTLKSLKGTQVVLTDATRIWSWYGANTLSEVSRTGVINSKSRISVVVPEIILTEAIEVIQCSEAAAKSLLTSGWAK